jgi:hypothetical protein
VTSLDLQKQLTSQNPTGITSASAYIVVITARTDTINDEGADCLNAGKFFC